MSSFAMRASAALCAAALSAFPVGASSADAPYPNHAIRFLINQPPGGPTDQFARMVAVKLAEALGQNVIAENRAGAGGIIAADALLKSPADGYTLLFGSSSLATLVPLIYKNLPYKPEDLQPVGALASYAMFLLVNPALPVTSVTDLIALAKEKPGTLSFASGGNGATGHLAGERLRSMANIDVTHIPYKGNVLGQQDVMAGRVSFMFDFHPTSIAAVQSGRLRMLASTGKERSTLTPDIPTLDESGLPGFNIVSWYAVFAPAGTPRPVIDTLNRTLIAMTRTPDMQAKLRAQAFEAMELTPEEITQRIQAETAALAPIVKQAGITAN